ncbi:uncharacterized protein [Spinacia oleracea]|uniref:Uncharacterized protein n=1 Tax=Spinacia oleracea TaxID=3562 RepID=A0ABM3QPG9_SPIOL|nr:uncharacterized protein LOC130461267 [Spinacia oleracea]
MQQQLQNQNQNQNQNPWNLRIQAKINRHFSLDFNLNLHTRLPPFSLLLDLKFLKSHIFLCSDFSSSTKPKISHKFLRFFSKLIPKKSKISPISSQKPTIKSKLIRYPSKLLSKKSKKIPPVSSLKSAVNLQSFWVALLVTIWLGCSPCEFEYKSTYALNSAINVGVFHNICDYYYYY